jgi:hypothetical protein
MVRPSHVAAPDLPGESGSARATLSSLPGHAEAPDVEEHGEGPEITDCEPLKAWTP